MNKAQRKVLANAQRMDAIASDIEANYADYGMTQEAAQSFVNSLDGLTDRMMEAEGLDPKALQFLDKDALVLEQDEDETALDTFDAHPVLEADEDDTVFTQHMQVSQSDAFSLPIEGEPVDKAADYWNEDAQVTRTYKYWND